MKLDGGCAAPVAYPFGSYYGRQLDYSHLGGNGVGTDFATLASGSLKPNAPSYNGQIERVLAITGTLYW
jgi:hypothetical protein